MMTPRTFEEAFIYENFVKIRSGEVDALIELPSKLDYEVDYEHVFSEVSINFKKVEFALKQVENSDNWVVPSYIFEGLEWLSEELKLVRPDDIASTGIK